MIPEAPMLMCRQINCQTYMHAQTIIGLVAAQLVRTQCASLEMKAGHDHASNSVHHYATNDGEQKTASD